MSVNLVNGDTLDLDFTAIADVIRTKTGSVDTIPYSVGHPENFVNPIKTMMVMPTKTASGSILSITDSADDVQLKEGKFNIAYNSNGVSSMAITRCKKNFWSGSNTISKDDSQPYIVVPCFLKAGTYTISGNITSDTDGVRFYFRKGTTALIPLDIETSVGHGTVTLTDDITEFRFFGQRSNTGSNSASISDLMIELGSTPSTYEAYSGDTYPVSFGTTIYGGYFESETGVLTSTKDSDGTDLATPVEYQLSKVDVILKAELSNLWCNTGDCEVEYYTPSSGGSVSPIFSSTLLVDNSAQATSFTLSDDYENYDFIEFEITSSSLGTKRIVTIPEVITDAFTYSSGKFNLNFWNSNNYCCYSHSGNTWTRTNNRYSNITKVIGIKCTNATVNKTVVYEKQAITATGGVITSATSLFDYDYLFFATCSGDATETQPCNTPICIGSKELMDGCTFVENKYNQTNAFTITEFAVDTWVNWFMCVGIKFT